MRETLAGHGEQFVCRATGKAMNDRMTAFNIRLWRIASERVAVGNAGQWPGAYRRRRSGEASIFLNFG